MKELSNTELIRSYWVYIFDSNCPMLDWMDQLFAFTTGLGCYASYLSNFQKWYEQHCQVIHPPKNAFDHLYEVNDSNWSDQTRPRPYAALPTPYSRMIDLPPFFLLYSEKETPEEVFEKIRARRIEHLEQRLQPFKSSDAPLIAQRVALTHLSNSLEQVKEAQLRPSSAAYLSGGFYFTRCPDEETQLWIRQRCVSFFELIQATPEYRDRLRRSADAPVLDISISRFRLVQKDLVQRTLNVCTL